MTQILPLTFIRALWATVNATVWQVNVLNCSLKLLLGKSKSSVIPAACPRSPQHLDYIRNRCSVQPPADTNPVGLGEMIFNR